MGQQVDKMAYRFEKYCPIERWSSYWHQIDLILDLKPESVLEIGAGDKTTASYIKSNTGVEYKIMDIAADLNPDFIGSAEKIDLADNSYDIVCAFQVLEHLPYDSFEKSLREMGRVAKNFVVISLPHWGRHFSIEIRLPFFKKIRWQGKFALFIPEHKFDGQHYWEIGKKGYPLERIKKSIQIAGLEIVKDYISFESPYHHFFILKIK
jgi:SAM-dependent methyltransferase